MLTRNKLLVASVIVVAGAASIYGILRWSGDRDNELNELLTQLPAEADAIAYLDLNALRQSPFLAKLYQWAPQPAADPDYAQFVQATGFSYERDLDRVAVAFLKHDQNESFFTIAQGRFDRKKIAAYAAQSGTRENRSGREIFSVPIAGNARRISFTFLSDDRIAWCSDADVSAFFAASHSDADADAWHERFRRLAGSPIFVVVRQNAGVGNALNSRTPGGFESRQISALLDQLQWIDVAGKPDSDHLRVVLEGEATAEGTARQLSDALNGLLMLAQAGLSDPKMRQQLRPQVREAYLELVKSADVSRIDRGATKSVRLIFDVTPGFLDAAHTGALAVPTAPQHKIPPQKSTIRN